MYVLVEIRGFILFFTLFTNIGNLATGDSNCEDIQCITPTVNNGTAEVLFKKKEPPEVFTNLEYGNYGDYPIGNRGRAASDVTRNDDSDDYYGNYENAEDGTVIVKYDLNTQMKIRCDHGFVFNKTNLFTGVLTCVQSSSACVAGWNQDPATICTPVTCSSRKIKNGKLTKTCYDVVELNKPVTMNSSACLRCEDGYSMTDSSRQEVRKMEVRCGVDGSWDISATCQNSIACAKPTAHKYGSILSFDRMDHVTFKCNDHFLMVGEPRLMCQRGNWSGDLPLCRYKASCLTNILNNGSINIATGMMGLGPWVKNGTIADYTCENGLIPLTEARIGCVKGEWVPKPSCVQNIPHACTDFPAIPHGMVSLTPVSILPGTVATVSCLPGYVLQGSAKRTCQVDGDWSGQSSSCLPLVHCGPPPAKNHTRRHANQTYLQGHNITYRCNFGYKRDGQVWRTTCTNSGTWTTLNFQCKRVSCGRPSDITNAVREGYRFSFGDVVSYKCREGYKMTGGILKSKLCQPNGRWTRISMKCGEAQCSSLPQIPHATLEIVVGWADFRYGARYRYICRRGYTLSGPDSGVSVELLCGGNGTWSRALPSCEIAKCPPLPTIPNASLKMVTGSGDLLYGDTYKYLCSKGYKPFGDGPGKKLELTCLVDGTWSRPVPSCKIIQCPPLQPPAHGHIRKLQGERFEYQAQYAVTCDQRYKMRGVQTGYEILRACQYDGRWTGEEGKCELRKVFLNKQEWASFLTRYRYRCCQPRIDGYEWSSECPLGRSTQRECIYKPWYKTDDYCHFEEVTENYDSTYNRDQVVQALNGIKTSIFNNKCCWVSDRKPAYQCYEAAPSSWRYFEEEESW